MTVKSPIHSWIRFWLKRNDREFEEQFKQEREQRAEITRQMTEEGHADKLIPADVDAMCDLYELERHQRNQFPVGAFFDMIENRNSRADCLFAAAEVGADLFYAAICVADEVDNTEFFVQAYERWGELVDTALQECDRPNRNVTTGEQEEPYRVESPPGESLTERLAKRFAPEEK